ncbi:hypothetical protein C8J56DRAFT_957423 [Mycena floridula]|nr:hypothetical protein C8J56DRAFT_957423 [Mycena floridula]
MSPWLFLFFSPVSIVPLSRAKPGLFVPTFYFTDSTSRSTWPGSLFLLSFNAIRYAVQSGPDPGAPTKSLKKAWLHRRFQDAS